MRTFTISQIKAHFIGVPYSNNSIFIGLLVRNKILVKIDHGYTYDLNKLNRDIITLISDECRQKQLAYNRKYYDNIRKK